MDRHPDLHEFQQSLAERLRNAGSIQLASALAVQAGPHGWLLRLDETAEVMPVPALTPVPLTRPWYLGVVNVRGRLVSVVDFGAFAGDGATPLTPQARMVLLAPKVDPHCALVVAGVHGLKATEHFKVVEPPPPGSWRGRLLREPDEGAGRLWREASLAMLARDEEFLQVGA